MRTSNLCSGRNWPLLIAGLLVPALTLPTAKLLAEQPTPTSDPLRVDVSLNQEKLLVGEEQEVVLKIDVVAGKPKTGGVRLPLNVAVVLDRSGSMSGQKLEQAKQAASMMVDRLEPEDVFALVTYESGVEVDIPATKVGDDAERFQRKISRIETGGSTALHAGVTEGGNQVREYLKGNRINRVLLLSDGLANVGPKSPREITRLGKDLAEDGVSVTTIGLGADFNEDLMTALAEASDANYYYVEDVEKLPDVFAKELGQLNNIVARDVEIHIVLPEGVTPVEIMGRTEKFEGREAKVRLSHFNASQRRELLVKAKLTPKDTADDLKLAEISGRYLDETQASRESSLSAQARARVTEDKVAAKESRNEEVVVRVQQAETDRAKTEAADLAVAGRKNEAKEVLQRQMLLNSRVAQEMPAAAAAPMEAENSGLSDYAKDFDAQEGAALSSSVKKAKSESWMRSRTKER